MKYTQQKNGTKFVITGDLGNYTKNVQKFTDKIFATIDDHKISVMQYTDQGHVFIDNQVYVIPTDSKLVEIEYRYDSGGYVISLIATVKIDGTETNPDHMERVRNYRSPFGY